MKRLLFCAEHVGSACAVIPLYQEVLQRSDLAGNILLPENLKEFSVIESIHEKVYWIPLQRKGYSHFFKQLNLDNYSALVTGVTGQGGSSLASFLISLVKKKGIPSIGVLDSWINYSDRFASRESGDRLAYFPDYLAIMDKFAFDDLASLGYPCERLWIVGHPYIETLKNQWSREAIQQNREEIFHENPAFKGSLFVVFVHEPIADIYQNRHPYDEYDVAGILLKALIRAQNEKKMSISLVIQFHPRTKKESEEKVKAFIEKRTGGGRLSITFVKSSDPLKWCLASDVVIGMTSVLPAYSLLFDKRVLIIQPGITSGEDKQIITRKRLVPIAVDDESTYSNLMSFWGEKKNGSAHISGSWDMCIENVSRIFVDKVEDFLIQ